MNIRSLSELSDEALARELVVVVARERGATARVIAHIAEFDARKLYVPAGYPSMLLYCVQELHLCEQAAFKRIHAARAAWRFPVILEALADGRLHLSAVVLLAPHLTEATAAELLAAATHRSKSQIEQMLAERFPRTDLLAWVESMPGAPDDSHAPEHVDAQHSRTGDATALAPAQVENQLSPGKVDASSFPEPAGARSRLKPLGPQSFGIQFTLGRKAHERLRYAQELLGHQVRSGDLAAVYERAIEALVGQLEKRKFGTTASPRRGRGTNNPRYVPLHVRRAVHERDGGQCTFVSESGRRCPARRGLEFDHVLEVARGGEATVDGIRLRCRAHNQYQAERTFGADFMRHKRIAAAEGRAAVRAAKARERAEAKAQAAAARAHAAEARASAKAERARAEAQAKARAADKAAAEEDPDRSVVPWLRALGFRAEDARRAAARCEAIPGASLEERIKLALRNLAPRGTRRVTPVLMAPA